MVSTRVLQQQGQQQWQFQQWEPQQQWRPQQQWCLQQQWRPQQPWGPGGSGSFSCSGGPASLGSRRSGRDVGPCQYRILTGLGAGTTCWRPDHSAQHYYSRLDDLYHEHFGPESRPPIWPGMSRSSYPLFDMSMDTAYSVTYGSLGLHVPSLRPLPVASVGTCAFSVGACVVTSPAETIAVASLSFTLDSGASQCFFRDHTTVTPLSALVPVALADPTSGPAVARSSTTIPCPAVPSGFLTGLYIPSFSRNLVGVGYLHDRGITVTFPAHGRTSICTDASTRALLATFTREPHSGLFVLQTMSHQIAESGQVTASPQVVESDQVTASPPIAVSSQVAAAGQVAASGQVDAFGQVAASCSCRSLAHLTVSWHHHLGHPRIPRLRSMASHRLVSGLPRVFASLPPSPAPLCTPCVAGRLGATPHSSSLRPATAPFQTLHLDVWGPSPTQGPERERYFLVVDDDYSRYSTVFPLAKKSEVTSTLIRWLLATEGTRGRRFSCLHSDRGGEFRSGILRGFCGEQGISQCWTLPESPQQNGVVECRIGFVLDIARTSMIHARAPHFLWPCAVRYAAHQLNLQPRVSRPEASPTSLWTRSPGVGSAFCVWGCLALFCDTSATGSPGVGSGGARSRGARLRGAGAGGASSGGAGAGGACTGGASFGGAGVGGTRAGGAGTGGASSEGAGAGGTNTGGAPFGDTGTGGASSEETGVGDTTSAVPAQPPYCHDTRLQAARRRAREEQEQLERERQELRQLDLLEQQEQQQQQQQQQRQPQQLPLEQQLFPPVSGLRALGLPSTSPACSPSLPAFGPTFPPPDDSLAVWSSPRSPSSPPVVPHYRVRPCPPRAHPSSLVTDLCIALFCSSCRRSPPVSVLPSPHPSSLPVSPTTISDYYCAARPIVSRVLTTLATDSHFLFVVCLGSYYCCHWLCFHPSS
ncbi:unnamed protein product [Closterium sp. NIES-53]